MNSARTLLPFLKGGWEGFSSKLSRTTAFLIVLFRSIHDSEEERLFADFPKYASLVYNRKSAYSSKSHSQQCRSYDNLYIVFLDKSKFISYLCVRNPHSKNMYVSAGLLQYFRKIPPNLPLKKGGVFGHCS